MCFPAPGKNSKMHFSLTEGRRPRGQQRAGFHSGCGYGSPTASKGKHVSPQRRLISFPKPHLMCRKMHLLPAAQLWQLPFFFFFFFANQYWILRAYYTKIYLPHFCPKRHYKTLSVNWHWMIRTRMAKGMIVLLLELDRLGLNASFTPSQLAN